MTHHHHHPGHLHPPVAVAPSLLRLSLQQRGALVLLLIAVMWVVTLWAM